MHKATDHTEFKGGERNRELASEIVIEPDSGRNNRWNDRNPEADQYWEPRFVPTFAYAAVQDLDNEVRDDIDRKANEVRSGRIHFKGPAAIFNDDFSDRTTENRDTDSDIPEQLTSRAVDAFRLGPHGAKPVGRIGA